MPEDDLHVQGESLRGTIVLRVRYGHEQMLVAQASKVLSDALMAEYETLRRLKDVKSKSCSVVIESEIAGSSVVRALFNVYNAVLSREGRAVCVVYPMDYIDSLATLGLLDMPGFTIASNVDEAVAIVLKADSQGDS